MNSEFVGFGLPLRSVDLHGPANADLYNLCVTSLDYRFYSLRTLPCLQFENTTSRLSLLESRRTAVGIGSSTGTRHGSR